MVATGAQHNSKWHLGIWQTQPPWHPTWSPLIIITTIIIIVPNNNITRSRLSSVPTKITIMQAQQSQTTTIKACNSSTPLRNQTARTLLNSRTKVVSKNRNSHIMVQNLSRLLDLSKGPPNSRLWSLVGTTSSTSKLLFIHINQLNHQPQANEATPVTFHRHHFSIINLRP